LTEGTVEIIGKKPSNDSRLCCTGTVCAGITLDLNIVMIRNYSIDGITNGFRDCEGSTTNSDRRRDCSTADISRASSNFP